MFSGIFLLVVSSAGGVYKQGTPLADVSTDRVYYSAFPEGELSASFLEEHEKGSEDRIIM